MSFGIRDLKSECAAKFSSASLLKIIVNFSKMNILNSDRVLRGILDAYVFLAHVQKRKENLQPRRGFAQVYLPVVRYWHSRKIGLFFVTNFWTIYCKIRIKYLFFEFFFK